MRAIALMLLVGCIQQPPPEQDFPPPPDTGWTGPTGDPIAACDDSCSGEQLCARDGLCYPPDEIWAVHASWTVGGLPANISTCANTPDLGIGFGADDFSVSLGFAPVPCSGGRFTIDRAPRTYTRVELGVDGQGASTSAPIDETGEAVLDL